MTERHVSVGSQLASFSLRESVLAVLAAVALVVAGALTAMYPAAAVALVAAAVLAKSVTGVARRVSLRRQRARRVLAVRVPYTDLCLEV